MLQPGDSLVKTISNLDPSYEPHIRTCSILTCAPNEMMADIHDRMPVILAPDTYESWLDTNQQDATIAARLLRPYPADKMAAWPVSTYVNKAGNEGERCIEPVGQQGLFG